jgi:uncharacterized protein YndB with AHSA1/START domain
MRVVTVHTLIAAPRERVFDFVADLAARPAYMDHYVDDYRLARANPYGEGAAARFRVRMPFAKEYVDLAVTQVDRPRKLVEELRVGRRGRNHFVAVYDFAAEAGDMTRVDLTTYGEPATRIDSLKQLGATAWLRRQAKMSLERLRLIFEDPPPGTLKRATVAGYEPARAARFGAHTGMDPAHAPPTGRGSA